MELLHFCDWSMVLLKGTVSKVFFPWFPLVDAFAVSTKQWLRKKQIL